MTTNEERIGIVETKVENLEEKIDDLKERVTESSKELKEQLTTMYDASCAQHAELAKKISGLEKIRERTVWMISGAIAVIGIFSGHLDKILAFLH
jgi:peptidoglycan hydrolase CwlO-like protein